jgi:hypothetical protein
VPPSRAVLLAGASALTGLRPGGLAVPALAGGSHPDVPPGPGLPQAELTGHAVLPALPGVGRPHRREAG